MRIEERTAADPDLVGLLDAAFAELVAKYGAEGRSAVRARARYLVAYVGDQAAGCGVVQPLGAETGEIKRMYVAPGFRGQGIARKLLAALEDLALSMEYVAVRMSTGELQPEAIGLYESSGYERTEPYGKYVNQPGTRCYHKRLVAETEGDPDPRG
jgi:putative acetyltransferase